VNQLGITREKLEISCGLKQRPLSVVELNAKNTVELYGKAARETREFFKTMKETQFNITKHRDYGKYTQIREMRNDLAKEILSDYPRHWEFVGQFAREYFISKRTMENQVAYAERSKNLSLSDDEIRARDRQLSMKRTDTELAKEGRGTEVGDFRQKTDAIIRDISTDFYMNSKKPVTKSAENAQLPAFFEKLETMKRNEPVDYKGTTTVYHAELNKNRPDYECRRELYLANFGYAPHVSKAMLYAHCGENGIYNYLHKGDMTSEYASMIIDRKTTELNLREPTAEIIESGIRQALCFKALQRAVDLKELSGDKVKELDAKAAFLSEHLTKENVHALNDKAIMREAAASLPVGGSVLLKDNISRISYLNNQDFKKEEASLQIQKIQESERLIDQSRDSGIGM
jgi:hypothetical protein